MRLNTGHIYVAPPDCHLLVETGIVRLGRGPKENRFRPAIDPLFRSAAQAYGPGAVGVILSGSLDDGSAGLGALKQLGGIAIVQAPRDALFPGMPANALRHVAADHVVPLRDMARVLADAVASDVTLNRSAAPEHVRVEVAADEMCEQITRGGPLAFVETPDAIDASRPPEILWEVDDVVRHAERLRSNDGGCARRDDTNPARPAPDGYVVSKLANERCRRLDCGLATGTADRFEMSPRAAHAPKMITSRRLSIFAMDVRTFDGIANHLQVLANLPATIGTHRREPTMRRHDRRRWDAVESDRQRYARLPQELVAARS